MAEPIKRTPAAGDIGIIEHPYTYDCYIVVRIVKVLNKMWELEVLTHRGEWDGPSRRKIGRFHHLTGDPMEARNALKAAEKAHSEAQKAADARLFEQMLAIASGTNNAGV